MMKQTTRRAARICAGAGLALIVVFLLSVTPSAAVAQQAGNANEKAPAGQAQTAKGEQEKPTPGAQAATPEREQEQAAATNGVEATQSGQAGAAAVDAGQLADILENDAARAKLVEALRAVAAGQLKQAPAEPMTVSIEPKQSKTASDSATPDAAVSEATVDKAVSPIRGLALMTAGWAEAFGSRVATIWHTLLALDADQQQDQPAQAFDATAFWNAVIMFVLVVVATLVAFFVLRFLAAGLFTSLGRLARSKERGLGLVVRRASAIVLGLAVDVVVVLLACAAGYAVGMLLLGEAAEIGTRATLFINAFAVVELVKVGIRGVFAPRYDELRLVRMSSSVAGWWSIRLRWFVGIIGYAMLVAMPIISAQLSPALGELAGFVVMAATYAYALTVIFTNRKLLTERLLMRSENASIAFFAVLLRIMARLWVILALAYFTTLFVASVIDPAGVLPFMLAATLQTLIAAAIALGLSGLLSRALGKRIHVSERARQRLPMLENRVNAYAPLGLKVARVIIVVAFALVFADAWQLFDLEGWIASAAGGKVLSVLGHLLIVLIGAALLWLLLTSMLEHKLGTGPDGGAPTPRQETLLALIRNMLAIVVITVTVMVVLAQIGVDIGPLIAAAGVLGLAIGFGAQKLVADVITGLFIQIDNALNTGDWVTLAGVSGGVEKLNIRSVSLRALDGTLHVVPFSSTSVVSNYNREFGYHVYSYRIAYREDIDEAVRQLRRAYEDLKADDDVRPDLLDEFMIPGVTSLAENAVEIRVMIKTTAGMQWSVGRAYNRLVKMRFDAASIEIPTAHRTLYFGRDKEGWSPPVRVRNVDTSKVALRADVDESENLDTSRSEADKPTWGGGD